jgi:hypothetical protein
VLGEILPDLVLLAVVAFLVRRLPRGAEPRRARRSIHVVSRSASARIAEAHVTPARGCVAPLATLGIDHADPRRRFEAEARADAHGVAEGAL